MIDNGVGIDNFDFLGKVLLLLFRKGLLLRIRVMIRYSILGLEDRLFILLVELVDS